MARSKSGRIVIEIDPILKRDLYLALEKNQKNLKEWFIKEAEDFTLNRGHDLFQASLLRKEEQ